jgi:hypothetical protein
MDVKFLTFIGKKGEKIRRFQYTAIDDATRVRALKVYKKHTQVNAIDFVDHIIDKFPFRIREIRTDNGHEFQAKFHWHVEDLGTDARSATTAIMLAEKYPFTIYELWAISHTDYARM